MKALYRKRLLKLAEHLEKGKLGHKKFYFGKYNADVVGHDIEENKCGYQGCAIGECPIVFPKYWRWFNGMPKLTSPYNEPVWCSGMKFFGISKDEFDHLFLPRSQALAVYGGDWLDAHATPKQVARNIRIFVAIKEREAKKAQ